MNTTKLALDALSVLLHVPPTNLVGDAVDWLENRVNLILDEEREKRDEFKQSVWDMSDTELEATFVPHVYQKDIYNIDYQKLWDKGIRLISYDIDDTINDVLLNQVANVAPAAPIAMLPGFDKAKKLVEYLHSIGFKVVLLTNAFQGIAKGTWKAISADDYFEDAGKPDTKAFYAIMEKYEINKSQMAHVGNNIRQDVAGGNAAGVTTCLVRNNGFAMKIVKTLLRLIGLRSKGHLLRRELKRRGIWRKHHKFHKNDQYYQLGEVPMYKSGKKGGGAFVPVPLKTAQKSFKGYKTKGGSKVKDGVFAEAPIEMFSKDKACIKLNKNGNEVLLLTPDNIESYTEYKKKAKKLPLGKTHYYYKIVFKDGNWSKLRMREKYLDAVKRQCPPKQFQI